MRHKKLTQKERQELRENLKKLHPRERNDKRQAEEKLKYEEWQRRQAAIWRKQHPREARELDKRKWQEREKVREIRERERNEYRSRISQDD